MNEWIDATYKDTAIFTNPRCTGFCWEGEFVYHDLDGNRLTTLDEVKRAVDVKIALRAIRYAL